MFRSKVKNKNVKNKEKKNLYEFYFFLLTFAQQESTAFYTLATISIVFYVRWIPIDFLLCSSSNNNKQ